MRSSDAHQRPVLLRLLLCVVGLVSLVGVGLLVGQRLGAAGSPTIERVATGELQRTETAGRDARALIAISARANVDAPRHAIDHNATRRTHPWALDGVLVRIVVAGIAATLLAVVGERRRRLCRRSDLPARAPPLLAFA